MKHLSVSLSLPSFGFEGDLKEKGLKLLYYGHIWPPCCFEGDLKEKGLKRRARGSHRLLRGFEGDLKEKGLKQDEPSCSCEE